MTDRLRPLSRLRPPPLLRRDTRLVLAPLAEETLMSLAEILVEGRVASDAHGETFFGSILLSIDLRRHAGVLLPAGMTAHDLLRALEASVPFRLMCLRAALRESRARTAGELGSATTQTKMRVVDNTLLVDIDVELPTQRRSANSQ